MKGIYLTFLISFAWSTALAQFDKTFIPAPVLDTIPAQTLVAIKSKLIADKSRVNGPSKDIDSYIKKLYDNRAAFVIAQFNDDYFIADNELTPYLQGVLNNIYSANPTIPRETNVYAYRSEAANAMSYGEGTIAFTLGLLARMETEAQVAFVLCHELAHYHARHADLKAAELARINFDPQLKKQVKAIERSAYGQYSKLTELAGAFGLSITRHSRDKEFEADSIALRLYLNTSYDLHAPVRVLEILDSADISLYTNNLNFRKYFDFDAYPFKDRWIDYTRSTTWYSTKENDSLHTHPSCARRIIAIKRQLLGISPTNRKAVDFGVEQSNKLRQRSEFEIAASLFQFRSYGRSLFSFLTLSDRYPDNSYIHAMIGQGLYQLYKHQKDHELGKVLALPDPRFAENYDRYLSFVHALRLMELASLSYHYVSTKKELYGQQEEFLYARWLTSTTEISQEDPGEIRAEYARRFPAGKYLTKMKTR